MLSGPSLDSVPKRHAPLRREGPATVFGCSGDRTAEHHSSDRSCEPAHPIGSRRCGQALACGGDKDCLFPTCDRAEAAASQGELRTGKRAHAGPQGAGPWEAGGGGSHPTGPSHPSTTRRTFGMRGGQRACHKRRSTRGGYGCTSKKQGASTCEWGRSGDNAMPSA